VDLETRSTVDLRKATPYRYTEDPEFRTLMGSYSLDGELVVDVESQEQLLDELSPFIRDTGVIKVAHNAPFERICFSRMLGLPVGKYLPVEDWHDTQAVAGCKGYPQKLAMLGPALGGERKDEAGTHLINWFCKPTKDGTFRRPEDHPEKWAAFVRYCHQDVVTLIDVDRLLGDFPTESERQVYFADQVINDIGLPIDSDTVRRAAHAVKLNQVEHERELSHLTGLAKPNNPTTLRAWFKTVGVGMRDLRAETVEEKLAKLDELGEDGDLSPRYRALELRQELAGTASKKFEAALYAMSSDDRIRGAFRYFGAHTGRWSGRGAQPQNLPRHTFGPTPDDIETLALMKDLGVSSEERDAFEAAATDAVVAEAIDRLISTGRLTPDELKRLVRATFTGPSWGDEEDLTVVDYSSIEARVIAWLAGEEWALEAFRAGRDIYVETAERMGGLTRAQGKIAVLALGYAGGVNSLRVMAGPGDDFINDKSDDQIRDELVTPWRKANPRIVRFWTDLEDAFGHGEGTAGRIRVTRSVDELGEARHLWLPSGRAISYHGVKFETYAVPVKVTVVNQKTGKSVTRTVYKQKTGWRYADPRDPFNPRKRIGTYGGRLAENVTQGGARDVMAEALVRLVRAGYRPVGHVHDEILTEGGDLRSVEALMTVVPKWAKGLPIDGEGFVTRRYKKG
jgi:DNA polymerase